MLNPSDNENPKRVSADAMLPLVYDELRLVAAGNLDAERQGHTLQPTALVHEAFLRLGGEQRFENTGHFFAAAAEAMRRILIENARRRQAIKRGGERRRVEMQLDEISTETPEASILALDAALERFGERDPEKAELVKLRYFAGLTIEQTAEALRISVTTANRWWAYARAWLHAEIQRGEGLDSQPEG